MSIDLNKVNSVMGKWPLMNESSPSDLLGMLQRIGFDENSCTRILTLCQLTENEITQASRLIEQIERPQSAEEAAYRGSLIDEAVAMITDLQLPLREDLRLEGDASANIFDQALTEDLSTISSTNANRYKQTLRAEVDTYKRDIEPGRIEEVCKLIDQIASMNADAARGYINSTSLILENNQLIPAKDSTEIRIMVNRLLKILLRKMDHVEGLAVTYYDLEEFIDLINSDSNQSIDLRHSDHYKNIIGIAVAKMRILYSTMGLTGRDLAVNVLINYLSKITLLEYKPTELPEG